MVYVFGGQYFCYIFAHLCKRIAQPQYRPILNAILLRFSFGGERRRKGSAKVAKPVFFAFYRIKVGRIYDSRKSNFYDSALSALS